MTKNRKGLLAGAAVLILVISMLAVMIYRAAPANTQTTNAPLADEAPVTVSLPASAETAVPTDSSAQSHQAETDTAALPPIPAEMAAEIRRLSNRSTAGLVEEHHADGSTSMDLQGRFQSVTAAVRAPDGTFIIRHGEDFLANVQPATAVNDDDKAH